MDEIETMDDLPIIDAHHHLWDLERGPLYYPWLQDANPEPHFLGDQSELPRVFLPDDYRHAAAGHCVVGTVHVEAECSRTQQIEETQWLTALHAQYGLPNAIVAHAWVHTPNAEEILAQQSDYPLVRGIRTKPVTRKSRGGLLPGVAGTMQDPAWRKGLDLLRRFGFSWDLRVPTWHLDEAAAVVRENPDLAIVLNHTGFPWDRSPDGLAMWRAGMRALAACPNCFCKLSCLCLLDGAWNYDDNRALVLETIGLFGVERCMFASNFPVDGVRISFGAMFDDFKRMTADFSESDRRRLFHDNAARFYRLD